MDWPAGYPVHRFGRWVISQLATHCAVSITTSSSIRVKLGLRRGVRGKWLGGAIAYSSLKIRGMSHFRSRLLV